MKTKATILTTLIAIAVIVGCKKEPDNPASPAPTPNPVTGSSPLRALFVNNVANATPVSYTHLTLPTSDLV